MLMLWIHIPPRATPRDNVLCVFYLYLLFLYASVALIKLLPRVCVAAC